MRIREIGVSRVRGGAIRRNIGELASEKERAFFLSFTFIVFAVLVLCTSISSELEPSLNVITTYRNCITIKGYSYIPYSLLGDSHTGVKPKKQ